MSDFIEVPRPTKDQRQEIVALVKADRWIDAIKRHREFTGAGLYASKLYVDNIKTEVCNVQRPNAGIQLTLKTTMKLFGTLRAQGLEPRITVSYKDQAISGMVSIHDEATAKNLISKLS